MQCNARRDLLTSLVGTVPLADVLADLPLPSPLLTPMEETVLGTMKMSAESKKLLDSTNPVLCSRITEVLLGVDTSFLDVKDSAQTVPYTPNAKDPPLIKAVMSNLLPQAVVRIEKLDPGLYNTPTKSAPPVPFVGETSDAVVPSHAVVQSHAVVPSHVVKNTTSFESRSVKKRKEKKKSLASADNASPIGSNIGGSKPRKKSRRLSSSSDETGPPRKRKQKAVLPETSESLCISIDRLSNQTSQDTTSKSLKLKQKTKQRTSMQYKSPILPPLPTELIVRISRARLRDSYKLPYSGEIHGMSSERPLQRDELLAVDTRDDRWVGKGEGEFAMAPDVTDHATRDEVKKVHKKKKHSHHHHHHHRGDQAKLAILRRFTNMVDGLFDRNISEDDLFNRMTISEILSQVSSLKQQGILHEVPVDNLIQLIGLMDKHVLDSANLLINSVPDDMENAKLWRELARDRILRSADSALVILHIITAPRMPKKVHLEESVDQVLALTKFHLDNNVYPQFDPVYKAENKESGMLPRQKRRTGGQAGNKIINAVYHKLTEVIENMAILTETQPLTDITVLMLSSMGTLPFFVENVSLLQLSALRLVRAIFTRYDKHRDLILEDIFASLQRLPTNKRNLRTYKLFNGQYIQMLTALVLQLTQCIVMPPRPILDKEQSDTPKEGKDQDNKKPDIDVQMTNTYNIALKTGNNFLSKFLKKCSGGGKDDDDFRPLFENFIQDLLTTLNLPMWPASEVFLTLLGMLLVQSFSNRSTEQSIRLMSLDHLGVIAARLRKDVTAPTSEQENEELVDILAQVIQTKLDRGTPSPTVLTRMDAFSENNQHLQKALVAYLNKQSENDYACAYARDFYIGQWLYDAHLELDRILKENPSSPTSHLSLEILNGDYPDAPGGISSSGIALQQSELKKDTILSFLDSRKMSSFKNLGGILDERSAAVVTRYLASSRALTRSFDTYLQKLIRVSNEPAVHVRTRAMKALSCIVAADPGILSRPDMQRAVEYRFCDMSTLVREAAVDLIGRFVLSRPELTSQYYDMICARIRDSGVSVRKRVIKILKDICVLQPDFPKIDEICVRIIKRISDEEAIKQLVTSVFRELWFTPLSPSSDQRELLLRRVTNITAVVGICKEYEWFEQLLEQILKNEDQTAAQAVLNVCQMMVDCLVENVLSLDENSAKSSSSTSSLMSCIITLYLFCNVKPSLLLKHATTLHPYLSSTCAANKDVMVLHFVSKILKEVVPLMEHPSETFLAGLEEDLVKLIMKHGQLLIHSCVECLGAVVNSVTHNYALVKDCFQRFFKCLEQMRVLQTQNPTSPQLKTHRASLLRSLFTVGVLCKFFDFDSIIPQQSGANPVSMCVYSHLIYFFKNGDEEIQIKTVKGLGLYCIRYPEMMLEGEIRNLINNWLTKDCVSIKKIEVLRNIHNYLKEVEAQLKAADTKWEKEGTDKENLLEFGDQHSSVSSNIAQAFLLPILESFFHTELQVRLGALQAVLLILRQGLVHPAQCVPYLMAMSTDPDQAIKVKADQHLIDHTSRYGQLMQTQLLSGVRKSYEFQKLIAGDGARGHIIDNIGNSSSLLSHIYVLVRSNKQHRRVFLRVLLRYFEDYEKNPLGLLLYLADTLAYLPYNTVEEPLFVVHHIDMTISIAGSNLLQQFKEVFGNKGPASSADDEEDMAVISHWCCDLNQLSDCCHSSQGCFLLLLLKQLLKKSYGLSDSKCQKYSPTESNKAYDKAANRRVGNAFDPKQVVTMVKQEAINARKVLLSKEECLRQYLEFKKLMNKMDPFEGDEDGSDQEAPPPPSPAAPPTLAILTDSASVQEQQKREEVPRPPSSRSRSSRASSSSSVSSRRGKKDREMPTKAKKKKRVIISSDSSGGDEDPDWT